MQPLVFGSGRWGRATLLSDHQAPKGLKFSDNGDELDKSEQPPQNVYVPCKKADPKKKHKRKLAQKSKRRNRG